ncbi:PASTA domain-containing protein [Vagococcus zengguangii]|uniref:PASTA domain-containing protein n=1 Tax=Vagococcus zengguangii TaxID=2571750 RepID=UPI0011098EC6|nr:PASTA domain-containing protein [Vagococcus zengguangii]TLG81404.1 PASTA domain-containing protein [Vagococcus zengguangii]
MSDFLSNFTNDNYENKQAEKKTESKINPEQTNEKSSNDEEVLEESQKNQANEMETLREVDDIEAKQKEISAKMPHFDEETQTMTDPSYGKKQLRKKIIIGTSSLVAIGLIVFGYHRMTTVKVPDFVGKKVSDVREWGVDTGVKITPEQVYDFDEEINSVIKQNQTPGERMKKKQKLVVYTSLGPDPEQLIKLPKFEEMTLTQAQEWITEQKAENVTITEEYNDKIEKNKLVKQEFSQKDFDASKYKREDQMILTYSKGKEVFEKNIAMPDFVKTDKSKLDEWIKANQIKADIKWIDADLAKGKVVSQSIEPKVKVAKRDNIAFTISKGKAIIVPNFAEYNKNNIDEISGLTVQVKEQFSDAVAFGVLISQSAEAGEKYYEGDEIPPVTVVYSAGQPYLRSYIGELEGDLAERFFNDYRSKGADITYTTYRMASSEPKGTVVKMSTYNEFVPTTYSVSIGISDGSLTVEEPKANTKLTEEDTLSSDTSVDEIEKESE